MYYTTSALLELLSDLPCACGGSKTTLLMSHDIYYLYMGYLSFILFIFYQYVDASKIICLHGHAGTVSSKKDKIAQFLNCS